MSIRGRGYPPPTVKTFWKSGYQKQGFWCIIKLKLTKSREKYDMIAVEFVFTPEHQGSGWERLSHPVRIFLFINIGFETKFLVVHCNVEFSHHIRANISMIAFSRGSVKFYDVFNIEH